MVVWASVENLLADDAKANSELPSLPADVTEDTAKTHAIRIEHTGCFLDQDVDQRKLVWRANASSVQTGKRTMFQASNQHLRQARSSSS
jgi:hypothetical protein